MWFFDTLLFDPRSTILDPSNIYTNYVILWYFSVWPTIYHTQDWPTIYHTQGDPANRWSNRKVSKNHIGGVKVSRIECGRSWVKQKSIKELWFFDTVLFDPRSTTLDPANLYTTYVIRWYFSVWPMVYHTQGDPAGSSVEDRGWNRKVSKNHIGGVKVSSIVLSVVDRGSNRKVSILLTFTPPMWFFDTLLFDPRSTTLKAILLTFTPPMWFGRSWVKQKSIKESHRWCKG
jgi:hypothetical protein